jgi:cysteine desulfurase/selenocysteine lyase
MELMATRIWMPDRLSELFPAFNDPRTRDIHYLDGAATSQRLAASIKALVDYESGPVGNAHRGAHPWAEKSSSALEAARKDVGKYLGIEANAVAFTSGATESANLLAQAARGHTSAMDVIFVSQMEHHSNYLPWLELARSTGCSFVEIPIGADGCLDLAWFEREVQVQKPKWVCVTAMSNVTGVAPPVRWISRLAKEANPQAMVVVDAAQAIAHLGVEEALWGGDFAFFSSHKIFAPSGSGVLAARDAELFDLLEPGKFGGGMIRGFKSNTEPRWASGHARFEAGSANVGAALGLAAALSIFSQWDLSLMQAHEEALGSWTAHELTKMDGVFVLGGASRHGLVSFHADWAHAHDIGTVLESHGVFARVGHHCALPLMGALGVQACVRLSFGPTSNEADAEAAIKALVSAKRRFT